MSMIARRRRRRTGGFTLIELLVVVSIIALLISILLPSLSRAREQAKLTVCKSNISSVGKTFILYLLDLNKIPLFQTSDSSWCSWSFGGWSGTNRDHWADYAGGVFNIETADRPLSVYALKGGTIARAVDTVPDDWVGGAETWPTEETPYYKCPSDRFSAQALWTTDPTQTKFSAYDDVGSSYQLNFHWWQQALDDPACDNLPSGEPALPCQVNLGVLLFLAIVLHKLPEGLTIASLQIAGGASTRAALTSSAVLGVATIVGVLATSWVGFLAAHGLALSAGVTIYVAASNLVPEFQNKKGWQLPVAFFLGAGGFFLVSEFLSAVV